MISNVATDPATGRQVIVANFESFRKKLEENIDKACNDFLAEPDWNKNFEIYDALNRTAYLCPFAVAALRRKLKTKEPEIEILALHLLEGMIKNVPSSHGAVAQPSFMRYLVKVALDTRKQGMMKSIGKKFKKDAASNSTHLRAQTIDKALIIIQMLKNAYENSNTYPIFVDTYKQLKKQGVKFPVLTKDETDQVFEPMHSNKWANYGKKGSKAPSAMGSVGQIGNSVVANHANIDRSLPMIRPVKLIEKVVDNELKTAQENAVFFFEMVNSSDPGENLNSNDLIQQLHTSVSEWQARVVMKISDPNCNPMIMDQGFQINDMMNNLMTDYQGLLIGTKRRYEEGLDIKNLSKKKKGGGGDDDDSNDDSEDDSSNKNKGDEKDDDSDDDKNKKHNKNKSKDIDPFIPPPPADEGNHSNHARRQSKRQSQLGKKRQSQIKKHQKQDTGDLLDMFGDNTNNNNNKNNPAIIGKQPSLQPEQSAINIFDIMGSIPSGPIPPSKTVGNNNMNNMNSMTNNGIMNSSQMNNSNNGNVKIGEASISPPNTSSNGSGNNNNNNNNNSSGFDALGDPFSGNAKSNNNNGNDFMGSADNPFDLMGGGGGINGNANANANRNMNVNNVSNGGNLNGNSNVAAVNNSNGSDNPFAGLNDDPFAGISSGGGGVSSNVAPANNNKAKNDFMGGDDNPFAFMGGSNNASNNNNNNNNTNKNQNNNGPKDDFLGGSNPFAFVD